LKESFWKYEPLKNRVISVLKKRQGIILDEELLTIFENEDVPISERELNEILMELEIQGIVHVSRITKAKRRIELIQPGQEFLPIGED
jgi:Fe2+ or Zn2+ uptake regulation protein